MTVFFISVFTFYFLLLVLLLAGWNKHSTQSISGRDIYFLSVVIPFRNETENLPALIGTLQKLNYPKDRFEILLMDDHSTDDSITLARELVVNFPNFKIVSANLHGKKQAIAQSVEISKGDIIVTTDADCEVPIDWLKSINNQFQEQSVKMVVGGVRIISNNTFFSKLQSIEFCSLIGSAAATLALGFPTMCNGANLSYRREVFNKVHGFEGNEHIASGDDEFLMRKVVKEFGPDCLQFLKDSDAVVSTKPQSSLTDFLAQRIRWAGKWRHNSSNTTKALAVFILLFQAVWLIAIGSVFFQHGYNTIFLLIVVKVLVEGCFLFQVSRFMRQKFSLKAFLVLQIIYPLYVIGVGVFSNLVPVSWKERPFPN